MIQSQSDSLLENPFGIDYHEATPDFHQLESHVTIPWETSHHYGRWQCFSKAIHFRQLVMPSIAVTVAVLLSLTWSLQHFVAKEGAACSECPLHYYTATACLLGGQSLQTLSNATSEHAAWKGLMKMLGPGALIRSDLEKILHSESFANGTRCGKGMTWNASSSACVLSGRAQCHSHTSHTGKIADGKSGSRVNASKGNCTSNLYRPLTGNMHIWVLPCSLNLPSMYGWSFTSGAVRSPSGLCATGANFSVELTHCNGSESQLWQWRNRELNLKGTEFCLNVWGAVGSRVFTFPCCDLVDGTCPVFTTAGGMIRHRSDHCLAELAGDESYDTYGGECTCPDGEVYVVADEGPYFMDADVSRRNLSHHRCRILQCDGGIPGTCSEDTIKDPSMFGGRVTCQPDFLGAAQLVDVDPTMDTACWNGSYPQFVEAAFLTRCPGYAPDYMSFRPVADALGFFGMNSFKPYSNFKPAVQKYSDFPTFYSMFYETDAGEICRAQFGVQRDGGPIWALE